MSLEALTDREMEVLRLLCTEMSGPEIAKALYVSVNTVKAHLKGIYGKLDVHSRRDAIVKSRALDLLP